MNVANPPVSTTGFFSLNSIEGILLIILAIFIVKESSKKIVNIISGIIFLILIFQVLFIVGQTPADKYLHLSMVFKYDAFTAIAQFFPGTKFAQILMAIGGFLTDFINSVVLWVINSFAELFEGATSFHLG